MSVRIVTWNVNGLRSCIRKGFLEWLQREKPEVVCLQEVRTGLAELEKIAPTLTGYHAVWHPAERAGYSGTAILSRFKPLSFERGLDGSEDPEGRALTADFGTFKVASLYGPNANPGTSKISVKSVWLASLRDHVAKHAEVPMVVTGDLNVALGVGDSQGVTCPPGYNGCTDVERDGMQRLMDECDLHDPVRDAACQAILSTWWSPFEYGRKPGNGIRLDYALVGTAHRKLVLGSRIQPEVAGSDHCPVTLTLDVSSAHLQAVTVVSPMLQRQLL